MKVKEMTAEKRLFAFDDTTRDLFRDSEFCKAEILRARGMMGSKEVMTDPDRSEKLAQGIGLILMYCPDEYRVQAEALILEFNMRASYMRCAL